MTACRRYRFRALGLAVSFLVVLLLGLFCAWVFKHELFGWYVDPIIVLDLQFLGLGAFGETASCATVRVPRMDHWRLFFRFVAASGFVITWPAMVWLLGLALRAKQRMGPVRRGLYLLLSIAWLPTAVYVLRTLVMPEWLEQQLLKGMSRVGAFCLDSTEYETFLAIETSLFGIIALALPLQALLSALYGLGDWRSPRSLGVLTCGFLVLPVCTALAFIDVPLTAALLLSGAAILVFVAAVLVGHWRNKTARCRAESV